MLNRPQHDDNPAINDELRSRIQALTTTVSPSAGCTLHPLHALTDILCVDTEMIFGAIADSDGVGRARKIGCDTALLWMTAGAIKSNWICSTDADATLPKDYFLRLDESPADTSAALYPFRHDASEDERTNDACTRYELRLHHYVLGLHYARSPYAFHTLGSCLAVRASNYAQVRGFPPRSAAEDFYLLNKLAKTGPIMQLTGQCISLAARPSARVPFGTGPAVQRILDSANMSDQQLYYHPACFEALRCVLAGITAHGVNSEAELQEAVKTLGLSEALIRTSMDTLGNLGLAGAIDHCRRQSKNTAAFTRHFHQWFDGFRTLKFIHGLRDAGWQDMNLTELSVSLSKNQWPIAVNADNPLACREALLEQWNWTF
ncbi:MAG: hypothetical protein V7696_16045 [Halioglobus sp.]